MPETQAESREWLTPQQVADELQCSYETVLSHIHLGTIRASDVSASTSAKRRPVYRIHRDHLEAFLEARLNEPPVPFPRRSRRRKPAEGITEFFK